MRTLFGLVGLLALAGCGENPAPVIDASIDESLAGDSTPLDVRPPLRDAALPDRRDARVDAAAYTTRPIWFLHLTDTHVGSSTFAASALGSILSDVLPVIDPTMTVLSGDLTDVGSASQFATYESTVSSTAPAYPNFLEVPGNHDLKTDDGEFFRTYSMTGTAGGDLDGISYVDGPDGRIRVVRTNTADSEIPLFRLMGYLSESQKTALLALPASKRTVVYSVAVGHHPVRGLEGLQLLGSHTLMEEVLQHYEASVYFCGHVHISKLSWDQTTLVVQGPIIGKPTAIAKPGFVVVGLDTTGPSARVVGFSASDPPVVSWPVVLVTAPADAALGGTNPVAKKIAPGSALDVRVLGFAPGGLTTVEVRIDSGSWTSLAAVDKVLWQTTLTTPSGGTSTKHTLEARGTSAEGTATHSVSLVFSP